MSKHTWDGKADYSNSDLDLLVETSGSIFTVCIEEHFYSVILNMGIANYFLRDGFIVAELLLHLKHKEPLKS